MLCALLSCIGAATLLSDMSGALNVTSFILNPIISEIKCRFDFRPRSTISSWGLRGADLRESVRQGST